MNPRRPYLMFLVIIIALTMIALFAAMYVDITHDDTEPPATSTNPAAVHKPYAVPVDLPDGRTAVCVFNNAGALACEWPSPIVPTEAPGQ